MRRSLPLLLSLNAGYVDTAGFLALKGLFTAHVTGNFVTLGSSLVFGTSGTLSKLLALPVFCAVVFVAAITADRLRRRHRTALRLALMIQMLLLVAGGCLVVWLAPFDDGDTLPAIATGMTLVAAMAIQNAAHRMYLAAAPPTTLMTGTTTQLMIDLAEVVLGSSSEAAQLSERAKRMVATIIVFAAGCAAAALLYAYIEARCFIVPPLIALLALCLRASIAEAEPEYERIA